MIPLGSPAAPALSRKPRASGDDPAKVADFETAAKVNPARAGMIL